jgi:hypothetical protein
MHAMLDSTWVSAASTAIHSIGCNTEIYVYCPESFFKLHDLNRDGILDRSELEAIYGLHHETSREKSSNDEEHKRKTDEILKKVLDTLDHNGDGVVTKTEFVSAGREGLPEFGDHEGLGHHYDSEGEYFLVSRPSILSGCRGALQLTI